MTPTIIENMKVDELVKMVRTHNYHAHLHSAFVLPVLASKVETELDTIKQSYEKQILDLEKEILSLEKENYSLKFALATSK